MHLDVHGCHMSAYRFAAIQAVYAAVVGRHQASEAMTVPPAGLVLFVCYMRTARAAAPKTLQEVRTELVRRKFPKAVGYSNMDDADSEALPADPALRPAHASDRAPLKQPHLAGRGAGS